ncbi:Dam family site-specific DNA-(adenine-N6)-methyltransferase [Pontibacter sp. JH31]|uniref:Site-specific DNA-methyltransferase (adenine-specific) n=1 Tax=Pontibacter aquaedesilientis TaxID=2766980 RepID=A0ABR7XDH5_9BACT|nr:Dam family site-specific DNA-(adenine-N6)-methyltransferase [Pontibacter aquaedesilientis]
MDADTGKPFLRWAGGKSWLIKYLSKIKASNYGNYHESFLGGGATFFYLLPKKQSYLSDLNEDLIETYKAVRDHASDIINKLKTFNNTEEDYYIIRNTAFDSKIERAAQFIYLNQTSYNGIYRVNLKGKYNVPYGFRKKDFIDEQNLLRAQYILKKAHLEQCDFYSIEDNIKRNDLVFLDPPYTVSHNNNGFIKYNEKIFSLEDQMRLSNLIDVIKTKGAFYILTNAAHKTIEEIFDKGDKKILLNRASLIGGLNSKRGHTSEFVFTNTEL